MSEDVTPRLTIPAEDKPEASESDGLKALNKLFVEADLIMNPKFDEYYKTIRAALSRATGATS